MDLAIALDSTGSGFDVSLSGYDLATESGLRSAVVASLFTDRRAETDDAILDGTGNRRGWWADAQFGSRLWLLSREKELPATLSRAREYTIEALQWLIETGVAVAVSADALWVRRGTLGLRVVITLADRSQFDDVFNYEVTT